MPEVALSTLSPGQSGTVKKLICEGSILQHLMEMGLTPGVRIEVVRLAPMGDPMDVKVRGYHLSLRKHEAEGVMVE